MTKAAYRWPKLWQSTQETPSIPGNLLADLGWQDNPFGSDRAEDDPRLQDGRVRPPQWQALMSREPTFLITLPGYGQTTLLRHMVHSVRHDTTELSSGLLRADDRLLACCFQGSMLRAAKRRSDHFAAIIKMTIGALLGFLACNLDAFDAMPPTNQQALCRLVVGHMSSQHIVSELQSAGLEDSAAAPLALAIAAAGSMGPSQSPFSESEIFQTLKQARPVDFRGYLLAVDISGRDLARRETASLAVDLMPLVRLALDLTDADIILKIGIPADLAASIQVIPTRHQVELGKWPSNILEEMLAERLIWVAGERGGWATTTVRPRQALAPERGFG